MAKEKKQKSEPSKQVRDETEKKCLTCHFILDGIESQQNCPVCGILIHTDCLIGIEGCTNCEQLNLK